MMNAAVFVFWVSAAALFYTPLGYLACLKVLSRLTHRPIKRGHVRPTVSVIVPVHNGAGIIRQKIENLLGVDYPRDLLQVIIVDDCSTDGTSDHVNDATLIRLNVRQGKPAALNVGLEAATGEIIAFSDVGVMLEPDALVKAVESFADPRVGSVSSEDVVVSEGGVGEGEGFYTRIDTQLRRLESVLGSVAGVSGSFYLVRRELCPPFPRDLATDMFSGLYCVDRGFRAVVDERSKVRIFAQADARREFDRKVRTMVTGLRALQAFPGLVNPVNSGLFGWCLFSHKLMRYLMPLFAILALFSSAYLAPFSAFYKACFLLAMAGLAMGFVQILWQTSSLIRRLPAVPGFLCTSLAAAVAGWVRFAAGERYETWQPTERSAV